MSTILLGCIADDFTGATDLANNLVRSGLRTLQVIGVPEQAPNVEGFDALVVALKTRTIEPQEAITESLRACEWLQSLGAEQIYFKYCSTFDSTPRGNIGPVMDALMDALKTPFTIACPAFPEANRTIYKGHLFVGDQLLSDSGMASHPLTPMKNSNLVEVLQEQSLKRVGLIEYAVVQKGTEAILQAMDSLQGSGKQVAIVDCLDNEDLHQLGRALKRMPLVTGGSGVAIGLAQNWGKRLHTVGDSVSALPKAMGAKAVIAGSCSEATNRQVAYFKAQGLYTFEINPFKLADGSLDIEAEKKQLLTKLGDQPILIYATATPDKVKEVQAKLGVQQAGDLVEKALASFASFLVANGVKQLVVAGGETSGAVVKALEISSLAIGPQIAPGVPWTYATSRNDSLHLTLKSGNFGDPTFFVSSFDKLNK